MTWTSHMTATSPTAQQQNRWKGRRCLAAALIPHADAFSTKNICCSLADTCFALFLAPPCKQTAPAAGSKRQACAKLCLKTKTKNNISRNPPKITSPVPPPPPPPPPPATPPPSSPLHAPPDSEQETLCRLTSSDLRLEHSEGEKALSNASAAGFTLTARKVDGGSRGAARRREATCSELRAAFALALTRRAAARGRQGATEHATRSPGKNKVQKCCKLPRIKTRARGSACEWRLLRRSF